MNFQENVLQTTFEAKLEKIKTILDLNPHPNIAPIKKIHVQQTGDAFGEYDQYNWNLKQYLEQIGIQWLSQQQIYNILNQIVQGYQHLRKFKIVHRDLCLETIFVEQHKDNIIVIKIGNFELASVGKARMSSTAGRLLFQAPEIYQIQNEYNEKCDIYSLGILFYYLCYQQEFHIKQLTKQNLDQFHFDLRNQKFTCPPKGGVSQECRDLLGKMIVCDDNYRISWDELSMHNILESNYMIINHNYYIQLGYSNKGQIEFKILNLQQNEYCCQEQIFSYGAVLNQLIQFGQLKYMGNIIQNLNYLQETLKNPNFQLLDIKQQIIMDDNLQNIIHQIQQYFPKDLITKDKLQTEINNLIQSKSTSNNNPSGQKIKILSVQTGVPQQQNQFISKFTTTPPVLNVQPQQQNLSNILPVQTQNKNEEDVFSLQIGDQQQEQNKQQFNQIQSNQLPKNNQQFQSNTNFQGNQFQRQSVLVNQPQTNTGNFKTNLPSFNSPSQQFPAGQVSQQQNNMNFQSGSQNFQSQSKPLNPPSFPNFPTAGPSDNQAKISPPFTNSNFSTAKLPDNQAQNPSSFQSQTTKPPDFQAQNPPSFQNSQTTTKPTDNQPKNPPSFTQPKSTDNQASINVFQSQKQSSSAIYNSPGQFQNQVQPNSVQFQQQSISAIQAPQIQPSKLPSNFSQLNTNQNQNMQQFQSQSVQQQQFQSQPVQQQQQFRNQTQSVPTNSNTFKQNTNIEQNKFQPNPPFANQFPNKATTQNAMMPNQQTEKNGVFDSQSMRQTQPNKTLYTREHEEWQKLTVTTQNYLEQSRNFNDYKNIYISLYHLNKYLIQKISPNNFNLNKENDDRALRHNFLTDNNFSQSVPNLDKANDQLVKQIDISKQYLQNTEKDETLKKYLRQLYYFEDDMKKKSIF